jgi:3-hydroxyisobutyrate dehydrogenase
MTAMPALAERHRAMGAKVADSPAGCGGRVDHVITCLPSPAVSEAVLAQMLTAMKPGATWIENSTLGRDDILRLAGLARTGACGCWRRPSRAACIWRRGARSRCWWAAMPICSRCTSPRFRRSGTASSTWGLWAAAVIKVITNMLAFIHLVADGEALMLAKRGGLDLKTAWEAIAASSGTSFVHETEGQLILNGSYDIAFTMDLALKDLGFAMGFGRNSGCRWTLPR